MDNDRYGERRGPFRHDGHRRPLTRREFLGQGFLTGAAWIAAPTLLGLLRTPAARAQALDCGIGGAVGNRLPFLVFDLGGGASTAGSNVLVGGPGGQLDVLAAEGYAKLGLPADMTPAADPAVVNTELGLAFHSDSALLAGIKRRASATTLANVNGCIFCARSDNDTGNNPHNPMYGLYRTGLDGDLLTLVGTRSSESGGNSMAPAAMVDPTVRPTKVDRPEDATGLVDTGKLIELFDQDEAAAVMLAAQNISDRKVEAITEQAVVKELIQCSFRQSTDLVSRFGDPGAFDPRLDPLIVGPGGIFPGGIDPSEFRKTASVMKLVLNRFAGAGTIEFGGYDYHDSTRATGERKDRIAGEAIGAALEYAARLPTPTPVVIYILTDGSVASDGVLDNSQDGRGKGIWKGDNSDTAATIMLVYDPEARPAMAAAGHQIGHFRPNGSVETQGSPIADSVTALAQAVVLNYVALHDDVGNFDSYLSHGLGSDLDALIAFAPLPRF